MNRSKDKKNSQRFTLLQSQNHLNYYTFLYDTDNIDAVRAAMQRNLLYGYTRNGTEPYMRESKSYLTNYCTSHKQSGSKPGGTVRRKSSSDISTGASRSNLPTDDPASESSTTRTNRSRDISDNTSHSKQTSHETGNTRDTQADNSPSKVPTIFVTLDIDTTPKKKSFFRKFLRKKSVSLESFFPTEPQTESKDNSKEEVKQKNIPLIQKIKNLFTYSRNSDRFRCVNAQTKSTSQVNLVAHVNQTVQENPQPKGEQSDLNRQSRRTAPKLAELKPVRSVKYTNGKNGSSSIQQTRRRSLSTRGRSTILTDTTTKENDTTNQKSAPPSPTSQEPVFDQAAHSFYIINNETPASSVTPQNSRQFRKAYLKSKKLNKESPTTSPYSDKTVSKGYNLKHVSEDTIKSHRVIHFELPQLTSSEETLYNYRETFERIDKRQEQETSYETKIYNQQLNDTKCYRQTNKDTKQDFGRESSVNFELHTLKINPLGSLPLPVEPLLEQQYYQEYIYEPQPGTSREYPPDRLVSKKIRFNESIKHSVSEDYIFVNNNQAFWKQVHQHQREPNPQGSDLAQSRSKHNRQHQDKTNAEQQTHLDDTLRPNQLGGVLKQTVRNTFWRRDTCDINRPLESPSDTESLDSVKIFFNELLAQERLCYQSRKQRGDYYQRPTLNSEYQDPRDYGYQGRENLTVYPDTRYIEAINSSSPEHRDNSKTHRFSREYHFNGMCSLEDHERKVIIEFCHLLEKSKQLFNGLRELPQYGHKQWHSYFGRTFDVYTKLWKFQQQHRAVLNTKYGLKRWQIGEIASKIGQLYYHFYIRTSEIAYLYEAYSFYYAIRGRSYYTKASKEDKCELMVKKLRYYARFIVVCLLLKKIKLVRDLIKELDRQIIEYGKTYDPDDQVEWTVVVDEVKAFVQAEPIVVVIDPDNYPVIVPQRLSIQSTPPIERLPSMTLSLQDVIIVGSSSHQVKFSELTMDMFRMLQTLEREPNNDMQHLYDESPRQRFNLTPTALNNKGYNLEPGVPHSDNPHKYLLFKPTTNQILVYLASSINDLPPNGALLVYMSADGQIGTPSKHIEDGYDIGGLITTSKSDVHREASKDQKGSQSKTRDVNSFHPGDLFPYTRRPLFVIIDSDNSYVFQTIPRHFGQPLVILMSPLELPPSLNVTTSDRRQHGNLFTLFLHSPLKAFSHCCDIHTLSLTTWDKAIMLIDTFMVEASVIITRSRIDSQYISFMGDDFLRVLTLRYIFCEVVLRAHRAFRTRAQLPRSSPAMPDDVLEHPTLTRIVHDLAALLQVRPHFQESPNGAASQNKE